MDYYMEIGNRDLKMVNHKYKIEGYIYKDLIGRSLTLEEQIHNLRIVTGREYRLKSRGGDKNNIKNKKTKSRNIL